MNGFWRIVWRIVVAAMLFQFCGASGCTRPVDPISYAPGYGYVVAVEQIAGIYGGSEDDWYVIFPTKAEAEDFYHRYYTDTDWKSQFRNLPDERRVSYDDEFDEWIKIKRLLQPPPPDSGDLLLPLTRSTLPDPIPPTPQ